MHKFATSVRLVLMLAFVFTSAAKAADKEEKPDALSELMKRVCDPTKPATFNQKKCDAADKAALNTGTAGFGCEGDYQSDYKKAQQEFIDACGEAGITSGPEPGNIGCGFAVAQCKCFTGGLSATEKVGLCQGVEEKVNTSKKSSGIDMESAKRMFRYCPAMASADYKKNVDKLEKSDEKLEKLEEKLPGLKDAAIKAQQDADEKQDTLDKEEAELDEKHDTDLADAKKNMSEEQKKLMDQMSQIQAQIATLDEQIGQFDLSKVDAGMKRSETITQIELNCHGSAAAIVNKKQEEALALLRAGQLNQGGQKAMMKRVGISDRQSWERVASKYYNWCLQSKPTIDSKASANKVFEIAIAQAEKSKADLRNRKKLLQEQLVKMKDPNGACGQVQASADGSSNETDMCRSAREAYEKQNRVELAWARKKQGLVNQKARAKMAGEQAVRMKAEEAAIAQRNLNKEKARRDKLQQWNDLADKKGVTDTGDLKAFNKAQSKFSAFTAQAQNLVVCSTNEEKPCANGNECARAKEFFKLVTGGREASEESVVPPSEPVSDLDATTGAHKDSPAMNPGSVPHDVKAAQ